MKTYRLHLLRNGRIAADEEGRYIGHTDVPLSAQGLRELQDLCSITDWPQVDAVFTSPLQRCRETALALFPDHSPITIDGLIEYNFGEFEGKNADELRGHPVFPAWLAGEAEAVPPFGESTQDFSVRLQSTMRLVVDGLLKTGTTNAAIVTHGGVIMALLAAFGLPQAPMHAWRMPNGCGYTLRITPAIWSRGHKLEVAAKLPQWE